MNARERFLTIMKFKKPDRNLLWEFAYWGGVLNRWYQEGLPGKYGLEKDVEFGETICGEGLHWPIKDVLRDKDVHDYFNLDEGFRLVPVNSWIFPPFERKVVEENKETRILVDEDGIKKLERKDLSSKPQYLEWPVKTREDWEKLKTEKFQIKLEDRFPGSWGMVQFPGNWHNLVEQYKKRGYPLVLGGDPCGFFGSLRFLMGEVNLFFAYHDKPKLVKDILNFLTDFWIALWSEVLSRVEVDCVHFWEDMAYRGGSLISPKLFREFMLPCYKRITDFFKSEGVDIIHVDSDGNVKELIPLFLEGGVTGLYPFEVQSGMDILKVRKAYPGLQILGGIDKRAIARGKDEIDRELDSKLPFMLQSGGYIPFLDHLVPPDVPWGCFVYYREKVKTYIENGNDKKYKLK